MVFTFFFGCTDTDKTSSQGEVDTEKMPYLSTTLLKMHEHSIYEVDINMSRVILSEPYGGAVYSYSIVDYGKEVWLINKNLTEDDNGSFYEEEIRYESPVDFSWLRDSLHNTILSVDSESIPNLSDNYHAILETKKGDTIFQKEVVFCRKHQWIEDFFEIIKQSSIDIFIPEC